ncbi:MAG TPA: hypothetical protein VGK56_13145 [Anaerolineales bacterium]
MKTQAWILKVFPLIFTVIWVQACGNVPPMPTVVATATIMPSLTPSTPFITRSPVPSITATPDLCNLAQSQDKIQVLSDDLLTALRPGGPTVFDRILVGQNPAWADFRQYDHDEMRSAGVIFHETAFGPELGKGINPAVILVTYGVERNWELPANGDLVSEVDHIRSLLFQYRSEWVHGQVDQSQYSMVANGATYVLYRYFNGNFSKLEDWCHTYIQVYGELPLK